MGLADKGNSGATWKFELYKSVVLEARKSGVSRVIIAPEVHVAIFSHRILALEVQKSSVSRRGMAPEVHVFMFQGWIVAKELPGAGFSIFHSSGAARTMFRRHVAPDLNFSVFR